MKTSKLHQPVPRWVFFRGHPFPCTMVFLRCSSCQLVFSVLSWWFLLVSLLTCSLGAPYAGFGIHAFYLFSTAQHLVEAEAQGGHLLLLQLNQLYFYSYDIGLLQEVLSMTNIPQKLINKNKQQYTSSKNHFVRWPTSAFSISLFYGVLLIVYVTMVHWLCDDPIPWHL